MTAMNVIFTLLDPKKKEQKRARPIWTDFLKNIFF
jgi:hypothetical protein